jgi:4-hydroxy-3-methylbut-2-en-1-yl diphosphate synthase IspG/GcpE
MSVTQVWQRLSVGGIGDAESNPIEITTVVTLCRETGKKFAPGVNCLYFPLRDARRIPAGRFDGIIDAALAKIGKMRTIEPNPILLSVKEEL